MEREVKVRIDLLLDGQSTLLDTIKAIQKGADSAEESIKRLRNLQATGNFQFVLNEEIKLLQKRNQLTREIATANQPFTEAKRRLDIEQEIFKIQQQRNMMRTNRPHEVALLVNQEYMARDRAEMVRRAQYEAKYGKLGGMMSGVDRLTMGPMGYAAMSGMMLRSVHDSGGASFNMLSGSLRRLSGEIGMMFIPAIQTLTQFMHNLGTVVKSIPAPLKTAIGYIGTGALLLSGGAKIFSMAANSWAAVAARLGTTVATDAASTAVGTAAGNAAGGVAGGAAVRFGGAAAARVLPPLAAILGTVLEVARIAKHDNKPFAVATGMFGIGPTADALRAGTTRSRAPLDFPFQSQQMDIFAMKDQIQMESMRTPLQQQDFNRQMEALTEEIRRWNEAAARDRGADENMGPFGRGVRNILVNWGIL